MKEKETNKEGIEQLNQNVCNYIRIVTNKNK